ncbi:MAG: CPBP family intramembrane metalloprotease [Bacteroidales bacterium]|nr:CPBP family intramembrane metalloprotease [Bacteroidales bacterium]
MKNKERIIYGFIITIVIYAIAQFVSFNFNLNSDFIPQAFLTHTSFLLLSVLAIYFLRKHLSYSISMPKFKKVLKPIAMGVIVTITIGILMTVVTKVSGGELEVHPAFKVMNPLQIFIFVFIYASIAEEILFRGFLQNLLKPLSTKGITVFKRKISLPVILSAIAFGLAHLILIKTGVGFLFLLKIVLITTSLGLVAGYYQEKYDNNAYAIIVHMGGNIIGVVGAILMSLSA